MPFSAEPEPPDDDPQTSEQQVTPWNLFNLALLIAVAGLSWFGYRMGAGHSATGGWLGALSGIIAGVLATPVVFVLLVLIAHFGVKLEDAMGHRHE